MPVELTKIPEKIEFPAPPNKRRWLFIIILIVAVGAMVSLYFWPNNIPTNSSWFWLCTLGLPLLVGIVSYALRLRAYENICDRIHWWNHLHQEQYDTQVVRGRRSAAVLGTAYLTPRANNKLVSALLNAGSSLQSRYFPSQQRAMTTAQLIPTQRDFNEEKYILLLEAHLSDLIRMLQPEFAVLSDKLSVRIHHDGTLDNIKIRHLWERLYGSSYPVVDLTIETENIGLMWLDSWLDKQERDVMLSVEVNLFREPKNNYAESVSALLYATPEWVTEYGYERVSALVHRPVVINHELDTFNDALLWGGVVAGDEFTLWRSQLSGEKFTTQLQSMDREGYLSGLQEQYQLDDLFGCPGAATGNILVICACEHSVLTNLPQWLMVGNKVVHQAIVRPVAS